MKRVGIVVMIGLIGCGLMSYFLWRRPTLDGQEKRIEFAGDRDPIAQAPLAAVKPIDIDGDRTMGYLKSICAVGPRISGTPGMKDQQTLIRKHFEGLGLKVVEQRFDGKQRSKPGSVEMTNLIVPIHPEKKRRVILCSHYDTRPIADQEPNPQRWRDDFVSANDGGSGVALLMELANHYKSLDLQVGIDLVFFDGEEYIFNRDIDQYFLGSKHFAQSWYKDRKNGPQYVGAILLDMIAGQHASFPVEGHSYQRNRPLVDEVWKIADEMKTTVFRNRMGDAVLDDHLSLQAVGIPAIDIIDFSYPHWHRLTDTPDQCSAEPMRQVARVLSVWAQRQR